VVHIADGVFRGFMNSRQTATLFGGQPNGHYKATEPAMVPLIRMSNTVFAGGDRDPRDIVREVDHGYYIAGHRIPSIAESRENFRISARRVLRDPERRAGPAVPRRGHRRRQPRLPDERGRGRLRLPALPDPNCGKGQPMQTKKLGNGGPTMRSRAGSSEADVRRSLMLVGAAGFLLLGAAPAAPPDAP